MSRQLALAFAVLWVLALPGVAAAQQSSCDLRVYDGANLLGNRLSEVQREAEAFERAVGATVRIRTTTNYGTAPNLDSHIGVLQRDCVSWQRSDGKRKDNILILTYNVANTETGYLGGDGWIPVFTTLSPGSDQPIWKHIRDNQIHPFMENRDYAGGFLVGLRASQQAIQLSRQASVAPGNGDLTIINQPPAEPMDTSWITPVSGGVLVLLVIVTVWVYGTTLRIEGRRARLAKSETDNLLLRIPNDISAAKEKLAAIAPLVATVDILDIETILRDAESNVEEASGMRLTLAESAHDPSVRRWSPGEYQAISLAFGRPINLLHEAEQLVESAEEARRTLEELVQDLPTQLPEVDALVTQAEQAADTAAGLGFRVPTDELNTARRAMMTVRQGIDEKRYRAASRALTTARNKAATVLETANGLPARKRTLDGRIAAATRQLRNARRTAPECVIAFHQVENQYVLPVDEEIPINPREQFNEHFTRLDELIAQAQQAVSMEVQNWDGADATLDQITSHLTAVGTLVLQITNLPGLIQAYAQRAKNALENATGKIGAVRMASSRFPEEIERELLRHVAAAEQMLIRARGLNAQKRPDYVGARAHADAAKQACEEAFRAAELEHESTYVPPSTSVVVVDSTPSQPATPTRIQPTTSGYGFGGGNADITTKGEGFGGGNASNPTTSGEGFGGGNAEASGTSGDGSAD